MKECKFRVGDRVDLNAKKSMADTEFKTSFANLRTRDVIFGSRSIEAWVVIYRDFNKRLQQWILWIENPAGEVLRFEENLLLDRPENFTRTMTAVHEGKTAREILGVPKQRGNGKKKFSVIFKAEPKDE